MRKRTVILSTTLYDEKGKSERKNLAETAKDVMKRGRGEVKVRMRMMKIKEGTTVIERNSSTL